MYAFVLRDNTNTRYVAAVVDELPVLAARLDNQTLVPNLAFESKEVQEATGWYEVEMVDKPTDNEPHEIYEARVELSVEGNPRLYWNKRTMFPEESEDQQENLNEVTIKDRMRDFIQLNRENVDELNAELDRAKSVADRDDWAATDRVDVALNRLARSIRVGLKVQKQQARMLNGVMRVISRDLGTVEDV